MADSQQSFLLKLDGQNSRAAGRRRAWAYRCRSTPGTRSTPRRRKMRSSAWPPKLSPGTGRRSAWIRPATPARSPSCGSGPARSPDVRHLAIRTLLRMAEGIDGDPAARDYAALVAAHERHRAEMLGQPVYADPRRLGHGAAARDSSVAPLATRCDIFAWLAAYACLARTTSPSRPRRSRRWRWCDPQRAASWTKPRSPRRSRRSALKIPVKPTGRRQQPTRPAQAPMPCASSRSVTKVRCNWHHRRRHAPDASVKHIQQPEGTLWRTGAIMLQRCRSVPTRPLMR
jgi:hypothetical protein